MIEKELQKVSIKSHKLANKLYKQYLRHQHWLYDESYFEDAFNFYQKYDAISINFKLMFTNKFDINEGEKVPVQVQKQLNINSDFYDGFGKDLISTDI